MKLRQHHFLHIIVLLPLTGLLFSCKSKPAINVGAEPVKEERLPVAKALELIHNAVVHSESYLWKVQSHLSMIAANRKDYNRNMYPELLTADSMIAVGKGRCWIALRQLEKIAEPDSVISYKGRAITVVNEVYKAYTTKFTELVNILRWSRHIADSTSEDIYSPIWDVTMSRWALENAEVRIREKHNIPRKKPDSIFSPDNNF